MYHALPIRVWPGVFGMIKLPPDAPNPFANSNRPFVFTARTPDELSVIAELEVVDAIGPSAGRFCLLRIDQVFGTTETGIFRRVADPLADAGVWMLPLGTHDTDYVLVREDQLTSAMAALTAAGHAVVTA